jgi:hypothetical protein
MVSRMWFWVVLALWTVVFVVWFWATGPYDCTPPQNNRVVCKQ